MAAPINRDAAKPALHKKQHLTIPGVGVKGPTVRECYDWASAPVLVVDLRPVFCGNGAHEVLLRFSVAKSETVVADDLRSRHGEYVMSRMRPSGNHRLLSVIWSSPETSGRT